MSVERGRFTGELRGEKVVLRPTVEGDAEILGRIVREPEVAAWWSPPKDYGRMLAVLAGGEVVGAIRFHEETDPEFRHAGIDVFLAARHHGKGLGTDAVRTLARRLVRERGHHRLVIDPAAANEAAIRSYVKVGFRPVGVLRAYWRDHRTGRWEDGLLMDLLARELT
ncbi:aminoglycoside 6'-N-acetyltransferase [Streptomyces sp. TverLS-915]|uniref:aminoglycoside 6'-N-acetyltransferase n=1 Tax=Streptomyces sp. TverLS-915 TaxID=1839763 RepID=UPI00081E45A3|nr:aminoglycoside 6'-N-acetyltransferase [Streptomyces sp. TverLS-915]SCD99385.1 aminoglycoside 6'-N-acetyltransferase [Streptomyces sp. TverLS-915]